MPWTRWTESRDAAAVSGTSDDLSPRRGFHPWFWAPALLCAGALLFALYHGAGRALDAYGARQGAALYQANCAGCHGADLKGQPDWQAAASARQGWRAPPLDAAGHAWMHDDASLFQLVKAGSQVSAMPAFGGRLSDNEIWQIFAFIKSRWPETVRGFQMRGDPYALLPADLPADWTYPPNCEPGAAP